MFFKKTEKWSKWRLVSYCARCLAREVCSEDFCLECGRDTFPLVEPTRRKFRVWTLFGVPVWRRGLEHECIVVEALAKKLETLGEEKYNLVIDTFKRRARKNVVGFMQGLVGAEF